MRVGSTWVTAVLERLLNTEYQPLDYRQHILGTELTQPQVRHLKRMKGKLFKTHNFSVRDAVQLASNGVKIVGCQRNFEDTLLSLILYCRDVRDEQGLPSEAPMQSFIDEFKEELEDEEYVNLFVDARYEYIKGLAKQWYRHQHVVVGPNIQVVNYDDLRGNVEQLVKILIKGLNIRTSKRRIEKAVEECSFTSMQDRHFKGHVRKGVIGDSVMMFDQNTMKKLARLVAELRQTKNYNEI